MLPSPPRTRMRSSPPARICMPSAEENGASMRCLTTSPAGTSTWTPASFRIDRTAGSVVVVTAGSRCVSSSTRLTGTWRPRSRSGRRSRAGRRRSRGAVLGAHEDLAVALRARARASRPCRARGRPSPRSTSMTPRTASSRAASSRTTPPDPTRLAPHLELGLHHHHGTPARRQTGHHRAPDRADRDEGQVTRHQVGRPGQVAGRRGSGRWCAPSPSTRGSWRSPQSSWP